MKYLFLLFIYILFICLYIIGIAYMFIILNNYKYKRVISHLLLEFLSEEMTDVKYT